MAHDYQLTATALKDTNAVVAELNCSMYANIAQEYGVASYPTMKLFVRGKFVNEYQGPHTQRAMTSYIRHNLEHSIVEVTSDEQLQTYLKNNTNPIIITNDAGDWFDTFSRELLGGVSASYLVMNNELFVAAGGNADDRILLIRNNTVHSIAPSENILSDVLKHLLPLAENMAPERMHLYRKVGLPLLVAFVNENNISAETYLKLETIGALYYGRVIPVVADQSRYASLVRHLGFTADDLPLWSIYHVLKEDHVPIQSQTQLTVEELGLCIDRYLNGTLKPRSEPIPNYQIESVIKVVGDTWEQIIDGSRDVLLHQYAPWCKHCAAIMPVLTELADSLQHVTTLVIAKIDAILNDAPTAELKASSYPTIQFFPAGRPTNPVLYEGTRSKESLMEFLYTHATHKFETEVQVADAIAHDHDEL